MTDLCTIGPVTVELASLYDGQKFSYSNSATKTVASGSSIVTRGQYEEDFEFDIICSFDEAMQIRGLVEQGELVWINTSTGLTDNDYFQHKGWVILTQMTMDNYNDTLAQCGISYVKISDYENEYFTMDYSRGIYDGVNLDITYTPTAAAVYQIQDDGTDHEAHWTPAKYYKGTLTMSSPASNIVLSQAAATDGTPSWGWTVCESSANVLQKFTPAFTFETVIERPALPAGYHADFGIAFSPKYYGNGSKYIATRGYGDWFEAFGIASSSTLEFCARTYRGTNGVDIMLKAPTTLGTGSTTIGLKIIFYADGKCRIYTDYGLTTTWTQQYYGPTYLTNWKDGLYLYLWVMNQDSTTFAAGFQKVEVYTTGALNQPNLVMVPPNAINVSATETGTRTVEDGTAKYFVNPTSERRYQIPTADFYDGSVKLLSINNSTGTSRQVYGTTMKLTPTTTTLKNGMTSLTFDADEVIIKGYSGGSYQDIQRIHFTDDIDYFKLLFNNSERVVLQINDTKWTMLRSSPIVTVEHPGTELQYTRVDTYQHGDATSGWITTSTPGAAADITMDSETLGYWCTSYNTASDTYRFVVVKLNPCTIKSDSLPTDEPITGLGWYNKAATGYDTGASLALQWYKQTRTGISMKQII